MNILLQKVEGKAVQGGHRFGKRLGGEMQAMQPVEVV
jgi:hypothetical protein